MGPDTAAHLIGWLVLFVMLAVLSYPPVAALVLLALVVAELRQGVRRLLLLAAGFITAYGLGVLAVYILNWFAFGVFGVQISAWRRPNPLVSLGALTENLSRYADQVVRLSTLLGWAGVIGVICLVWALVDHTTRRTALVTVGGVLIVVGVEAALTIYSGVVSGARASLWAWPAVCLPAALLLKGIRLSRLAGVTALAGIAVVGAMTWRVDLADHQETRVQYDGIVADVAEAVQQHPSQALVMWIEPRLRRAPAGAMTAVTIQHMLYDQHGLYPTWCTPVACADIADAVEAQPTADVLQVDGLTVVRIPHPPAWL